MYDMGVYYPLVSAIEISFRAAIHQSGKVDHPLELEQFQYRTRKGTLKSFMDPAVYTSNRLFRMLLCHKFLDNSRTVLLLNSSPTLQMFVRSCITQIDTRAWRVPHNTISRGASSYPRLNRFKQAVTNDSSLSIP